MGKVKNSQYGYFAWLLEPSESHVYRRIKILLTD